nr:unnamed protein product [Callosobruchus chinensis]
MMHIHHFIEFSSEIKIFSSATRRNNLKVAVVKLKHGAGIIGDACPSTRGVESGGRRDPYSIETHPSNSVPWSVLT